MILPVIQSSRVKTALLPLLLSCAAATIAKPDGAYAQSCGGTIQSQTVATTVSGASPNTTVPMTIPTFDYTGGYTLLAAVFTTTVTSNNTITFLNNSTPPAEQSFFPEVQRTDQLKLGTGLINAGSATYDLPFTDLVNPGDDVTYGPENFFNNTPVVHDSMTTSNTMLNLFATSGPGTATLSYKNTNFYNDVPNPGVQTTVSETDNVTLTVTYYFCNPMILSESILDFTATLNNNSNVALDWLVTDEQVGRRYDVEMSEDGNTFSVIYSRGSNPVNGVGNDANYMYDYPVPAGTKGNLWFRLRQANPDGKLSYSPVRMVTLQSGGGGINGFLIYPNPPTTYIDVDLPGGYQDWELTIYAANGNLVQQQYFMATMRAHMVFNQKLAAATYFVRAVNTAGTQHYTGSFVIKD